MTVPELVAKLQERQYRADAIARIIGYAMMIQALGWDGLGLTRMSRHNLQKTFRALGLDPRDLRS